MVVVMTVRRRVGSSSGSSGVNEGVGGSRTAASKVLAHRVCVVVGRVGRLDWERGKCGCGRGCGVWWKMRVLSR